MRAWLLAQAHGQIEMETEETALESEETALERRRRLARERVRRHRMLQDDEQREEARRVDAHRRAVARAVEGTVRRSERLASLSEQLHNETPERR